MSQTSFNFDNKMTLEELYRWAVNKSRIDSAEDREVIGKLEGMLKDKPETTVTQALEDPSINDGIEVMKRRGRPYLFTWQQYLDAGILTKPATEVAKELGVSFATVYKAKKDGLAGTYGQNRSKAVLPGTGPDREFYEKNGLGKDPDIDVAKRVNLSRERVRQIRVLFGMPRPPKRPFPILETEEIQKHIDAGLNVSEIGRAMNKDLSWVTYRLQRLGWEVKHKGPRSLHSKEEVTEALKTSKSLFEASTKLNLKHYSHLFRYIDRFGLRAEGIVPDGRLLNRQVK